MACPNNKLDAIVPPAVTDDSCNTSGNGIFTNGSFWFDEVEEIFYMLIDDTCGAAVWQPINQKEQLTFFEAQLDPLKLGGTQTIARNSNVLLLFDDVTNENPGDVWDSGAKTLTLEHTGKYIVSGSVHAPGVRNNTGSDIVGCVYAMALFVNGGFYDHLFVNCLNDMAADQLNTVQCSGQLTARFSAGDILSMYASQTFPDPMVFTLDNWFGLGVGIVSRKNSWSVLRVAEFG